MSGPGFVKRNKPDGMTDAEFWLMVVVLGSGVVGTTYMAWTWFHSGVWLGPPAAAIGYMAWRAWRGQARGR